MIKRICIHVLSNNRGWMILKQILKIIEDESINFNNSSVPNYLPDILVNFK